MDNKTAKPFISWAGGKGQLLNKIREKYPEVLDKYCEPFVGGGAILIDILTNRHPKETMINDINPELVNTYVQIKNNVAGLIKALLKMQASFLEKNDGERKNMYYASRERFNNLKLNRRTCVEKAALFIFLNKLCFNGLYRVNNKGFFNVPMGIYKGYAICDADNLRSVSGLLRNVQIRCGDYHGCDDFIGEGTFVYIDPPYRPITASSSFTSYYSNEFGDKQQIELGNFINKISARGARVLVSNSDPKNRDKNDNFFDNLYSEYDISRVFARRVINCKAAGRGDVSELLICNY